MLDGFAMNANVRLPGCLSLVGDCDCTLCCGLFLHTGHLGNKEKVTAEAVATLRVDELLRRRCA